MSVKTISRPIDVTGQERVSMRMGQIKMELENRAPFPTLPTTETSGIVFSRPVLKEADSIKTSRLQSYKHWPNPIPNGEAMSSNGWFYCLVNDRTICIYCNTVCHNWKTMDDPYEVHARLAPECPFIRSIAAPTSGSALVTTTDLSLTGKYDPRYIAMCELSRREKSFDDPGWTQTSPSIEALALAGFFYPGNGNAVNCFYCGGALHQWSANDNPKIEHARWFPNCLYARHLCGDRLYGQIQATKKQLASDKNAIDRETLIRSVNARLDLPVVQRLREKYALSIIKRCIEDQLRMNHDDFQSDNDLTMACFVLQKQIDAIQGDPDRIITPSQHQIQTTVIEGPKRKVEECLICLTEEKQLACMPCGHLCACVSCGYAVRSCPMCREKVQSFVRIYC